MKRKRPVRNPVAKHAARFQRADVHRDRTKYRRKPKHRAREPFADTVVIAVPAKGSCRGIVVLGPSVRAAAS